MTDRRAVCLTCRYWLGHVDALTAKAIPSQCRALPPGGFGWPETRAEDWCGAHQQHTPTAAEMGMEARPTPSGAGGR